MSKRRAFVCLLLGQIAQYFSTGQHSCDVGPYIAITCHLLVLQAQLPLKWILLAGSLFGTTFLALQSSSLLTGTMYLAFSGLVAVETLVPFVVYAILAGRIKDPLSASLVLPTAFVAVEFAHTSFFYASHTILAYTQRSSEELLQIVSVTGVWGVTFLVAWFASAAAPFVSRRESGVLKLWALVVTAVLVFGTARLSANPVGDGQETVKIASITPLLAVEQVEAFVALHEAGHDHQGWAPLLAQARADHEYMLNATAEQARAGARIVFWPELAVAVAREDEAALVRRAGALARAMGIYVGLGLRVVLDFNTARETKDAGTVYGQESNKFVLVGPNGGVLYDYVKENLVPMIEAPYFKVGPSDPAQVLSAETPYGTLASPICFDADSPATMRSLLSRSGGADIVLHPAFGWPGLDPGHAYIARARALEWGVSLIHHETNALSLACDTFGRIRSTLSHGAVPLVDLDQARAMHAPSAASSEAVQDVAHHRGGIFAEAAEVPVAVEDQWEDAPSHIGVSHEDEEIHDVHAEGTRADESHRAVGHASHGGHGHGQGGPFAGHPMRGTPGHAAHHGHFADHGRFGHASHDASGHEHDAHTDGHVAGAAKSEPIDGVDDRALGFASNASVGNHTLSHANVSHAAEGHTSANALHAHPTKDSHRDAEPKEEVASEWAGRHRVAGDGRVMVAVVPVRRVWTVYARFGDWFAHYSVGVLLALFVVALRDGRGGHKGGHHHHHHKATQKSSPWDAFDKKK